MIEKNIQTRIQNKIDTSENWEKATSFVPKKGEIILYSDLKKYKVGDGSTLLKDLEFFISIDFPVDSVNGKTGSVQLSASDVGARPNTWTPTASDVGATPASHATDKNNPHGVTKSQVGLGNVDNTSDANKPVSTAQATAIADAKSAGTTAQTNLNSHTSNKSNPHGVTAAQVGARPNTWMPSASDVGAAPTSHKHSADNIEGGTLSTNVLPVVPVEKGGTGTTSLPSFRHELFPQYGQTSYIATFGQDYNDGGFVTPDQLRNAMGALSNNGFSTHSTVLEAAMAMPKQGGSFFAVNGSSLFNAEDTAFPGDEVTYLMLTDESSGAARKTIVAISYAGGKTVKYRRIWSGGWRSDWQNIVSSADIGGVTEEQVTTMINNALGVIENGAY